MSLNAGGLAQMTYNPSFNGGLGLPSAGFASRGKPANPKRLSVTTAPKMGTIDETQPAQPRTSRSHLLAGLRTAPKSATFPASAPPTQLHQPGGLGDGIGNIMDDPRFARPTNQYVPQAPPKSATSGTFNNGYLNQPNAGRRGHLSTPSQVLAPPSIEIGDENGDEHMDPALLAYLEQQREMLAQQQLYLQKQLISVTAAARGFQNLSLEQQQVLYPQAQNFTPNSIYTQQLQQGVQPVIRAVPGYPGLYLVDNPLTGGQSYLFDQNHQQQQPAQQHQHQQHQHQHQQQAVNEQGYTHNFDLSHSPPPPTPTSRVAISPPRETQSPAPVTKWRTNTPPKVSSSPPQEEHTPLPPPSANAFRPSHRKNHLSIANPGQNLVHPPEGQKTGGLRSAGFPMTPLTGTFGPGQAREGEHPVRQPRGPPSLEELIAKPTSKHEGSKNFATRQRRRAVNNLVRAGIERRGATRATSMDDVGTPTSENEVNFSVASDNESIRSGSASLSGKPSLGNLRPSTVGAIGSERAVLRERSFERGSVDSYTGSSVSSEDGFSRGDELMDRKAEVTQDDSKRKSTLAILNSAEKRRSSRFY